MATHTLTMHRLPDQLPLAVTDVALTADMDSFAWTLQASGAAALFDQLAPTTGQPVRVRVDLDGMQWVFVVDSMVKTEAFGQRGTRISGRSPTAMLAEPYSLQGLYTNTAQRTAQQLAAEVLDTSGFTLDWRLDDWLVPAGAWSHQGTPLQALQAIAGAAGGHVLSSRNGTTLVLAHPYPTLPGGVPGGPWNWQATGVPADVQLATDALVTVGTERRDSVPLTGVWVSGAEQGVGGLVRRSGTAGNVLGPMQVDPLITAEAAAQQRGLSVLGAAGAKHLVQIELPILTGTNPGGSELPGVLDVGQLVQINTATPWRGRVRSVSARASFGKEVRQTVSLERHLEAA